MIRAPARLLAGWSLLRDELRGARKLRRAVAEALGSDRYSYTSLNGLDRKLRRYLDFRDGFFIEAGANDGITQSNTYWFERFRGWRGILVEGLPELAAACRQNRPRSRTVQAALVADEAQTQVTMKTANLMSIIAGAFGSEEADGAHLDKGLAAQGLASSREEVVPARTLSSILSELAPPRIDLLSLDVEGYELQVLRGLDLARHRPRYILVEAREPQAIDALLGDRYERIDQFSHHDYLYACRNDV